MTRIITKSYSKAQQEVKRLIREGYDPSEIKTITRPDGLYVIEYNKRLGIFGA